MTSLHEQTVRITKGEIALEGILGLPVSPRGVEDRLFWRQHRRWNRWWSMREEWFQRHLKQTG